MKKTKKKINLILHFSSNVPKYYIKGIISFFFMHFKMIKKRKRKKIRDSALKKSSKCTAFLPIINK